jgi:hypothetical protein
MRATMTLGFGFCDFDLGVDRLLGRKIGVFAVLAATISLTAQSSFSETTECRTGPGAPAPQGKHWYYRVDRTNNRHCWYLQSAAMQVRSHVPAKSNPESSPAKQALASLEQPQASSENVSVQTASTETVPDETPFFEPPVGKPAVTNFGGRWFDLPKSVDLTAGEFATSRTKYADERVSTDATLQMPAAWFVAQDSSGALRYNSAGAANFGSILLAGALGMLACGGALKLTRLLHNSGIRRRLTSNQLPYDPVFGLRELLRNLRRAEGRESPRSFAPLSRQLEDSPIGDYVGHRAHSTLRGLERDPAMV